MRADLHSGFHAHPSPRAARRAGLLAGLLLLPTLAAAADIPAPPAVPVLALPEPLYDAGTVTGRVVSHTFTLRNEGASALAITRLRACCGARCELTATNLPPGAVGELRVRLDLAGRSGAWRKTLYLHTNDPVRPIAAIRLTGRLDAPPVAANSDFDAAAWKKQMGGGG